MKRLIFLAFSFTGVMGLQAQTPDTTLWTVNGNVNTLLKDGNTLYLGGNFTGVAANTGALTRLNTIDAARNFNFPAISPGIVYATVPDGNGGWYVGGSFTYVNGLNYSNLIHILPNGELDTDFRPAPNNIVLSLAVHNNRLYVAGEFSNIGGQSRGRLAAIDLNSGLTTTWNPGANGDIHKIFISGNRLFAAGEFSTFGGQSRGRIASINLSTDIVDPWNPAVAGGEVNTMLLYGGKLYFGGTFTSVGGQSRNRIAAVDTASAAVTNWNPNCNSTVLALAAIGPNIYAGGSFTAVGGLVLNRLAALDTITGAPLSWNPNPDNIVRAIEVSGNSMFVGGNFQNIGGKAIRYIAKLNLAGQADVWDARVNNTVYTIYDTPAGLIAGGSFNHANEQTRNRLAAIDLTTGNPTSWNPNADNVVDALVMSGNTIYIGGNFTNIGGTSNSRLAAVDKNSGSVLDWRPLPSNRVRSLLLSGNTLYVGGDFTSIGGVSRNRIAALTTGSIEPTTFNPNVNNSVYSMLIAGNNLYFGGSFTTVSGTSRTRVAAVNLQSGSLTPFNAAITSGTVSALLVMDELLYIGGSFTNVSGMSHNRLAAVDTSTGTATSWTPSISGTVWALASASGILYVGGDFTTASGLTRNRIAAFDPISSTPLAWNPNFSDAVYTIKVDINCSNEVLYVGGAFSSVAQRNFKNVTAIGGVNQVVLKTNVQQVSCFGANDAEVNLNITGGAGPFTFSLNGTDFQQSGQFASLSPGFYTFSAKDANGCIISRSVTIVQPTEIVANEIVFPESCGENNGGITLQPTGGTGVYSYLWSNGQTGSSLLNTAGGTYTVNISDNSGCSVQRSINIPASAVPGAAFSSSSGTTLVNFTDISTGMPTSWNWNFGNGSTSTDQNPSFDFETEGTYTVCLEVSNACGTADTCADIQVTIISIDDAEKNLVNIWPNPASNYLVISGLKQGGAASFRLIDLNGREVSSGSLMDVNPVIGLEALNSGVYFLQINSAGNTYNHKLIIN